MENENIAILPNVVYPLVYEHSTLIPLRNIKYYGNEVKPLGKGAYGVVYKYFNKQNNTYYAIKFAVVDDKDVSTIPTDFLVEIALMKKLRHINIASIIDVVHSKGAIGIVKNYAVSDLSDAIRSQKFTHQQKDKIAYQLLSGVAYMHSRHILHRDIKPSNILFDSVDDVKISDLGMAKPFACDPNNLWTNPVYTLGYRPLEILLSETANYSMPADIWALAVTLWELYVGRQLFIGNSEEDIILHIFETLGPHIDVNPTNFPKFKRTSEIFKPKNSNILRLLKPLWPYRTNNEEIGNIIVDMLEYDPMLRPSAYGSLRNLYFDNVRDVKSEKQLEPTDCLESNSRRDLHPAKQSAKYTPISANNKINLINAMAEACYMAEYHLRTFLLATTLLEIALPNLRYGYEDSLGLAHACVSLAANVNERYVKSVKFYIERGFVNDDGVLNDYRLDVLESVNYDLLHSTSYDYRIRIPDRHDTPKVWGLTKSFMMVVTLSPIKYKLFPSDIFDLCVGLACKYYAIVIPDDKYRKLTESLIPLYVIEITLSLNNMHSYMERWFVRMSGISGEHIEMIGSILLHTTK